MEQQQRSDPDRAVDLVIVGGGLAGLLAANHALDAGLRVALIESRSTYGGRGGTREHHGYRLNHGPHALYVRSDLDRALRGLGIKVAGRRPPQRGSQGFVADTPALLPQGPLSLARTRLLSGRSKRQFVGFAANLFRTDPDELGATTVSAWLDDQTTADDLRHLLTGLVNLTTYNWAADLASADAAATQLRKGLTSGVVYVKGGWGTIVDRLVERLAGHPRRELLTRCQGRVEQLSRDGDRWRCTFAAADRQAEEADAGKVVADAVDADEVVAGEVAAGAVVAGAVVLAAGGPKVAARLLQSAGLDHGADLVDRAGPAVQATVLDLGLRDRPHADVVLGLDDGLYGINHTNGAPDDGGLAPESRYLFSLLRYLRPDEALTPDAARAQLLGHAARAGIESAQIVMDRYLHRVTVAGGMPMARTGGLRGRPPVASADRPGIYLAGDWVGDRGLLADAAAASATAAVTAVVANRNELPHGRDRDLAGRR